MMTPSLGMEKNLKLRWMKMLEEYSDFKQFASGRLYARPSSNKIYPISFILKEAYF